MPSYWMLVSSAENFEISRAIGFTLAGMKSRHRKKAEQVAPGDRVLFYLTGVQAFGGTATVTGTYAEDRSPLWRSKTGDPYPFRFPIRPDVILPADRFVPAEPLVHQMAYAQKWPAEHWHLAFQGNVHRLPEADFALIEAALRRAAAREPVNV